MESKSAPESKAEPQRVLEQQMAPVSNFEQMQEVTPAWPRAFELDSQLGLNPVSLSDVHLPAWSDPDFEPLSQLERRHWLNLQSAQPTEPSSQSVWARKPNPGADRALWPVPRPEPNLHSRPARMPMLPQRPGSSRH